ncbi:hypothetical protein AB0I81_10485 [Nonomuraea sp. NPDC050404]|uniref:hypothetical protein n=1 Tax=Nonomuraea sp. NPDC050404 TaxID=3155783 RepID=UPI003405E670
MKGGPLAVLTFAVLVVVAGLVAVLALLDSGTVEEAQPIAVVTSPSASAPSASAPNVFKTSAWTQGVDPDLPRMLVVGVDIEPGTYTTQVSLSLTDSHGACMWARLSGLSGASEEVIASGGGRGPHTVTILATDKAFVTGACQEWVGPS